jgi:hypothetical protein
MLHDGAQPNQRSGVRPLQVLNREEHWRSGALELEHLHKPVRERGSRRGAGSCLQQGADGCAPLRVNIDLTIKRAKRCT